MPPLPHIRVLAARQSAADPNGGIALDVMLALSLGVVLETWRSEDGRAIVDLLKVPENRRRCGIGRRVYRMWEDTLADGTIVELFSVDADAAAFWRAMGFHGRSNGIMCKLVTRRAECTESDERTFQAVPVMTILAS